MKFPFLTLRHGGLELRVSFGSDLRVHCCKRFPVYRSRSFLLHKFDYFGVFVLQMELDFKAADKDADGKLSHAEISVYLKTASLPQPVKQHLASLYDTRIPNVVDSKSNV